MTPQPVSLTNTLLPLAVLALAAFLLPRMLTPDHARAQATMLRGAVMAAGLTLVLAVMIFASLQALTGAAVFDALAAEPVAAGWTLLRPALLSVLAWGPVLVLSAFGVGQRIERRRDDDIRREGRR